MWVCPTIHSHEVLQDALEFQLHDLAESVEMRRAPPGVRLRTVAPGCTKPSLSQKQQPMAKGNYKNKRKTNRGEEKNTIFIQPRIREQVAYKKLEVFSISQCVTVKQNDSKIKPKKIFLEIINSEFVDKK